MKLVASKEIKEKFSIEEDKITSDENYRKEKILELNKSNSIKVEIKENVIVVKEFIRD